MKEVISDVLKAESDAERSIRDAREKRDEMKSRLEAEISEMIKEAKSRAQQIVRESIQKARVDASREQEKALLRAEDEAEKFTSSSDGEIQSIIEEVCELIISPDLLS